MTARVVPDAEGGLLRTPPSWINVVDYPSIQAAIDAVPAHGGVVYIPYSPVPYDTTTLPSYTPPIKLPADRSIRLTGDGPYASVLKSTNANADMVHMAGDYQTVENLALRGPAVVGTGRGIRIWRDGNYDIPGTVPAISASNIIYRAAIRDVLIENTASWGIYVDTAIRPGGLATNFAVWGIIERVEIRGNQADGCIFLAPPPAGVPPAGTHTTYYFHACHLRQFKGYGFRAQWGRGFSLLDCILETSFDSDAPFVSLESCSDVRIQSCWFEGRANQTIGPIGPNQYAAPLRHFIETSRIVDPRYDLFYHNIAIEGCLFHRSTSLPVQRTSPKVLKVGASGRNVMFIGNEIGIGPDLKTSDPTDPQSIAILVDDGAQATIIGGSQSPANSGPRQLDIVDATLPNGGGLSLGTMNLLRVPRVTTATYSDYDGLVKLGDIVYDPTLLKLRVCVAFQVTTPPKPIWKSITLDP